MRKLLTRAASGIVGIALAVGIGVAINNQKAPTKVRSAASAGVYQKVTSVAAGDRVIFVNAAGTHALGDLSKTSSGYGTAVAVTVTNSEITLLATTIPIKTITKTKVIIIKAFDFFIKILSFVYLYNYLSSIYLCGSSRTPTPTHI